MIDSITSFIADNAPGLLLAWFAISIALGLFIGAWLRACSDGSVHEQRRKRSGQRNGAIGAVHGERNAPAGTRNHA